MGKSVTTGPGVSYPHSHFRAQFLTSHHDKVRMDIVFLFWLYNLSCLLINDVIFLTEPASWEAVARGEQPCELSTETGSGAPAGPRGCGHRGQPHKILHLKSDMSSQPNWIWQSGACMECTQDPRYAWVIIYILIIFSTSSPSNQTTIPLIPRLRSWNTQWTGSRWLPS